MKRVFSKYIFYFLFAALLLTVGYYSFKRISQENFQANLEVLTNDNRKFAMLLPTVFKYSCHEKVDPCRAGFAFGSL